MQHAAVCCGSHFRGAGLPSGGPCPAAGTDACITLAPRDASWLNRKYLRCLEYWAHVCHVGSGLLVTSTSISSRFPRARGDSSEAPELFTVPSQHFGTGLSVKNTRKHVKRGTCFQGKSLNKTMG